ncbi:MAG: PDZ domain-containing protein, partial [Solirubrobacterales bacterium]
KVDAVSDDMPAAKSGMKVGDIITKIDGQPIDRDVDLARGLDRHAPGDQVALTIVRNGRAREVPVRLGTRPRQSPRG